MPRANDDGHSIRVGGARSLRRTDEIGKLRNICQGMKRMLQIAHQSRRRSAAKRSVKPVGAVALKQRSAVRVTYMKAKSAGHWYAHGSYMERETAAGKSAGFSGTTKGIGVASTLQAWQAAGDERIFKVIISPENGARLDMETYTREVMDMVQKDRPDERLEWVAAVHTNTDHPHIHVAIRGVALNGKEVRFSPEFIKDGFRGHAEEIATRKLGYRSQQDVRRDLMKQIDQARVTTLDQQLRKLAQADEQHKTLRISLQDQKLKKIEPSQAVRAFALERRLQHLVTMGLAEAQQPGEYTIKQDFLATLKTVQSVGDKQKMLLRHMDAASATTLPVVSAQWKDITVLQGRVLGHGEIEGSEKRYMLFEGIDGKVYHLPHRKDTEELRSQRHLRKGEFVTVKRERGKVAFVEMGHAEHILRDKDLLAHIPYRPAVQEPPRPGWLGKFDKAVTEARTELTAAQGSNRVAVPLSADQVRQLLRAEYPYDRKLQDENLRRLFETEQQISILGGKVELDYQIRSGAPYAEIDITDKPLLDNRLRELTEKTRRQQSERSERQYDRNRNRDKERE